MKSQGTTNAEHYLDKVFSADEALDKIVGSNLKVDQIVKAGADAGLTFTEGELREAIVNKLQSRTIQTVRFCFSESPHA